MESLLSELDNLSKNFIYLFVGLLCGFDQLCQTVLNFSICIISLSLLCKVFLKHNCVRLSGKYEFSSTAEQLLSVLLSFLQTVFLSV